MKRNLMAKLALSTTMALGAMVPMTTMVTSIHAEETQPIGQIDGMWDHHNIENLEIKLDGQLKYNEKEQTQKIKVKDGDIELEEDKDYKIEGNKATDPGEYEMTVTGINDFHGEVKVKFTVAERPNIRFAQYELTNELTENGTDQTQNIKITFEDKILEEGKDYTVEGNVANNAGEYTMLVSGINDFGGSMSIGYTVKAAPKQLVDISTCDIKLQNQLVEKGKDQKQGIIITYYGTQLAEGLDYTVEGNVANKAGQYTMTVNGIGNFEGSVKVTYTVNEAPKQLIDISTCDIKLEKQLVANGKDQKQGIIITYYGSKLAEGLDYTVEGNVANKAGQYTMTVKGAGNFNGTVKVTYTVTEAPKKLVDISTCNIQLQNQLVANGKDQKQGIIITYYGTQLAEGLDYTVDGNVANKAGQYTMTVKGAGNFQGTVKVTYTVAEAKVDFTKAEIKLVNELTENGKDQEQKIKVTMDGKELKEHTDYIIENNMAKKAGTYKMTVKGMGKYEGSKEVEFKVAEKKAEKEEKKEEKTEEKSNMGLYVGAGIGATGLLAAVLTFLKFTKC